jgi:hypothetical protein
MKTTQFAAGLAGFLLVAEAAFAGNGSTVPLGSVLGEPLSLQLGLLLGSAAVSLVVGIRIARRKRSK